MMYCAKKDGVYQGYSLAPTEQECYQKMFDASPWGSFMCEIVPVTVIIMEKGSVTT